MAFERERILAAYARSDLTQRAFARREGINYHTLSGWLSRYGGRKGRSRSAEVSFAEVAVPAALRTAPLEVLRPDGTVLRGSDPESLARLLRLLSE